MKGVRNLIEGYVLCSLHVFRYKDRDFRPVPNPPLDPIMILEYFTFQ